MEVGVPEPAHVLDFITADLARLPGRVDAIGRGSIPRRAAPLAQQPLRLHVPPHGRVGRQGAERRVRVDEDAQIVDVELIAPTAVGVVLRPQRVAPKKKARV